MIKSTLSGKAERDRVQRRYPAGLEENIYELAQLQDSRKLNEDTYDMSIKMFTYIMREEFYYKTMEYYRKLFHGRDIKNNSDSDEEKKN